MFIVVYIDYGRTSDGYIRHLASFRHKECAEAEMKNDVKFYLKQNPLLHITKESSNYILIGNEEEGCLWQILKVKDL